MVSPTGEHLRFFVAGEDILVQRANGQQHFYCPEWHWEMALVNLRVRGWREN